MKVKSRTFDTLTASEQNRLLKAMEEEANRAVFESQADMQIIWLKLMCIALHRAGRTEEEIMIALGNWRRLYRQNSKIQTEAEQSEWLNRELADIFPNGIPEDYLQGLKKL